MSTHPPDVQNQEGSKSNEQHGASPLCHSVLAACGTFVMVPPATAASVGSSVVQTDLDKLPHRGYTCGRMDGGYFAWSRDPRTRSVTTPATCTSATVVVPGP